MCGETFFFIYISKAAF